MVYNRCVYLCLKTARIELGEADRVIKRRAKVEKKKRQIWRKRKKTQTKRVERDRNRIVKTKKADGRGKKRGGIEQTHTEEIQIDF